MSKPEKKTCPPNVIYIHTHDMGRMIEPYGAPVNTPSLQRFAGRARSFTNAHCVAPTCSPSRSALLTGRYPHEVGMLGLSHRGFALSDTREHLGQYLQDHGCTTALCGLQHEFPIYHEKLPYTQVWPNAINASHEDRDRKAVADAMRFLDSPPENSFFLSVGLFYPHRPFLSSSPERDGPLPGNWLSGEGPGRDWQDYAHTIEWVDGVLAPLLDRLGESPWRENTLVIVTTDHGPPFPEQKGTLYDRGTGVTLMIQSPDEVGGKTTESMVSHLHLFPTITEFLRVPTPSTCRGQSLWPLLKGETWEAPQVLFSETTFHAAYEPMRAVRTDRYKLIRRYRSKRIAPNCDDSPSKSHCQELGWWEEALPSWELYDLVADPGENVNLAEHEEMSGIRQTLAAHLEKWMKETRDPLLHPPVAPPPGAIVDQD